MGDETDMNYIREINAFYDWLETNELSTSAISLWYALMHINNKTGWKNDFTVALSVLSIKSGLSQRAVTNARIELTEKGRIKWQSRNGNQAAQYTVNSLVGELQELYADNTSHNTSDNASNKVACNTSILVKPNINENKNINIEPDKKKKSVKKKSEYSPEFLEWYEVYPRPQSKTDSFKNFEKVRKDKGLDYIWECTRNYIDYYDSLPEEKREYGYSSNNFFGQKMYCEDFEAPKQYKAPVRKPQTYEHDESGRGAPVK